MLYNQWHQSYKHEVLQEYKQFKFKIKKTFSTRQITNTNHSSPGSALIPTDRRSPKVGLRPAGWDQLKDLLPFVFFLHFLPPTWRSFRRYFIPLAQIQTSTRTERQNRVSFQVTCDSRGVASRRRRSLLGGFTVWWWRTEAAGQRSCVRTRWSKIVCEDEMINLWSEHWPNFLPGAADKDTLVLHLAGVFKIASSFLDNALIDLVS